MAAPSVVDVMKAIDKRLDTIPGLHVASYAADKITPPQAITTVPPINYGAGLGRARAELDFTVTVLVAAKLDRVGQQNLAAYADPTGEKSIRAAFEDGDRTLDGLVEDVQVTEFDALGLTEVGVIGYYGGEFTVRVLVGD